MWRKPVGLGAKRTRAGTRVAYCRGRAGPDGARAQPDVAPPAAASAARLAVARARDRAAGRLAGAVRAGAVPRSVGPPRRLPPGGARARPAARRGAQGDPDPGDAPSGERARLSVLPGGSRRSGAHDSDPRHGAPVAGRRAAGSRTRPRAAADAAAALRRARLSGAGRSAGEPASAPAAPLAVERRSPRANGRDRDVGAGTGDEIQGTPVRAAFPRRGARPRDPALPERVWTGVARGSRLLERRPEARARPGARGDAPTDVPRRERSLVARPATSAARRGRRTGTAAPPRAVRRDRPGAQGPDADHRGRPSSERHLGLGRRVDVLSRRVRRGNVAPRRPPRGARAVRPPAAVGAAGARGRGTAARSLASLASAVVQLGAHVSTSGGIHTAIDRIEAMDGDCVQIFTQSPRTWRPTNHDPANFERFKERRAEAGIDGVLCHALYLINLASPDDGIYEKSVAALENTVDVACGIEADGVVFHVGSHQGAGLDVGLKRVVQALKRCSETTWLLMENSAGAGGTIGRSIEELAQLHDALDAHERLGICLDSCHLYVSGYDVTQRKELDHVLAEVDDTIGLERLRALHVNDSKAPLGSNRDRHENIGDGILGRDLGVFLSHPKLQRLPAYLEVPGTDGHGPDAEQVRRLKALHARAMKTRRVAGSARTPGNSARRQAARKTRG